MAFTPKISDTLKIIKKKIYFTCEKFSNNSFSNMAGITQNIMKVHACACGHTSKRTLAFAYRPRYYLFFLELTGCLTLETKPDGQCLLSTAWVNSQAATHISGSPEIPAREKTGIRLENLVRSDAAEGQETL